MSTIDKASLVQIPSGYKNGKLYSVKPTLTFGSELVTNGDFSSDSDWTKGTGWTISGGKANCDGSQTSQSNLYQSGIVPINKTYKATFDIVLNAGSMVLAIGGSNAQPTISASGTYTFTSKATSGDSNFYFSADADFVGSIDNVSVKEITNIGDFTFSRSSSATRVNSAGLVETAQVVSTTELVTNGDFATDSDWSKGNKWTISGGTANKATDSTSNISQVISGISGKRIQVTFTISNQSGSGGVGASANGSDYTQNSANGTYTEYITPTSDNFYIRASYSFVCSIDNVSVKEVFENDVPRLDYSGGASCASLLLEGQSTNLITYSESLSNTNRSGTFVDNSAISPDGTQNATKITATSTDPFFYQSVTLNASTYTASLWVKGIGDSIGKEFRFAISNQTHISNKYIIPSEWTRFEFTATVSAGSVTTGVEIPDPAVAGDEVLAWGWQLEESSYATSYIPSNSGSSTTRTADVCNNAGTSATFNDSEGVLFAEISRQKGSVLTTAWSINNGSLANSVNVYYYSTNILYFDIFSGVTTVSGNVNIDTYNLNKIALKYKSGDISLYANGLKLVTNTNAISLSGLNDLDFNFGAGNQPFYGKCKQLMVFDEALSDEELSDLTGQANLSFNNLATFYGYTIL